MSQCFTCPPLVIARNQASGQNLVESTKLGRIIIDSKRARRKGKKEKKERRKEKHEKSHKHLKKAHDFHRQQFHSSKKISDESDQIEKSGLTEELEDPQNHLGYLSDGSQNSKKRKRDDSPSAVESLIKAAPVAGNPLRIRFILKKPKKEVPVLPREDFSHQNVKTSSVSCSKISEPDTNLPSTSVATIVETKKRKNHKPSKEDRYSALFDDWAPSSIGFVDDSSSKDNEWLFGNMTREKLNPKAAVKIDEDMNMSLHRRRGDFSWPRAQFLSEVGIHSLPYTVSF